MPDFRQVTMNDFVRRNIEPGSTICTDKMPGLAALPSLGYAHQPAIEGEHSQGNAPCRAARGPPWRCASLKAMEARAG